MIQEEKYDGKSGDQILDELTIGDLQTHLRTAHGLAERVMLALFNRVTSLLINEPNVFYLHSPITVCGDIHGQILDLFKLFEKSGEDFSQHDKPKSTYLFMGDYVDRGYCSIEVFAFLAFIKIKYPESIYLLRGNHEYRATNQQYGLFQDCLTLYGHSGVWYAINNVFDYLPIAAVIDNRIFCVHGGLSPKINYIGQISALDRTKDYNDSANGGGSYYNDNENKLKKKKKDLNHLNKSLADLTWSDPDDVSKFVPNRRGSGYIFGPGQTFSFLYNNNLLNKSDTLQKKRPIEANQGFIARAHQLAQEGYSWLHNNYLVIVWSAPNYTYKYENKATIMKVQKGVAPEFLEFEKDENSSKKPNDELIQYFV